MLSRLMSLFLSCTLLTGCATPPPSPRQAPPQPQVQPPQIAVNRFDTGDAAAQAFLDVVARVEPVAENICRGRTTGVNCDFRILVDDRPGLPANAFQTLDRDNRPIIAFTIRLIAEARNTDELAFVMGHEAAHHIEGHIARQRDNAVAGALILSGLVSLTGAHTAAVQSAQRIGAQVGARRYSKNYELEADALGTVITARAGYDPLRGAQFFNRISDPGNRFLGTHPPNAARLDIVRRTAAGL